MIIELTNAKTGKPFYVNINNILYVENKKHETGRQNTIVTWVSTDSIKYTITKETAEEIQEQIDKEKLNQEKRKREQLAQILNK